MNELLKMPDLVKVISQNSVEKGLTKLIVTDYSCVILCLSYVGAIFTGEFCLIFADLSIFSNHNLSEIFAQSCRYIYGRNRSIGSQWMEVRGQKQNNRVSESRCPVGSGYQKGRRIWWQDI
jgi:hypothetical protein